MRLNIPYIRRIEDVNELKKKQIKKTTEKKIEKKKSWEKKKILGYSNTKIIKVILMKLIYLIHVCFDS